MRKWCDDLRRGDQVVHIYKSDEERAKALLDLVGWMREDEKLVLLCDAPGGENGEPCGPGGHVFEAAVQEGRMEVRPSFRAMCPAGKFHAGSIQDLVMLEYGQAMDGGFGCLTLCIDLSWVAERPDDFSAHVVQLSHITLSNLPSNLTLLCQYDGRRMSAELSEKALRVHQLSLADGRLVRNYWVVATSALGRRERSIRAAPAPGAAVTGQEK